MLYIKQDINFLEYPLWFPSKVSEENGYVWKDKEGYTYRSAYKVPDKTDAIILFYLLLKAQKQDYQEKFILSQHELLKGCGFYGNSWYYERLEDSLRRWTGIMIEFKGTFYDGKKYKTLFFHILDSAKIREEDQKVEICFNPDFLLKIKESKFCKYINFQQYKALKRPISLRLFEILCKNFKGREEWPIDLVKLGAKLPLSKRKVQSLKAEKELLFHSDVLRAIKPAINEINRLAEDQKALEALGVKGKETFKINYSLSEDKKVITFEKVIPEWVSKEAVEKKTISQEKESDTDERLEELLEMAKVKTKGVEKALDLALNEQNEEYVRWNILYANKEAKKNYEGFLKKALEEDWGKELRAEEERKEEEKKKALEEQRQRFEESKRLEEEIERLNKKYFSLKEEEQETLWEEAKANYYKQGIPKSFKMPKEMVMAQIREILKKREKTERE
jgi:hypothetical protein